MKIKKVKTYQEAVKKCPKGYRIAKMWELWKLGSEGKLTEEKWVFFFSSEKYSNYLYGLCVGINGYLGSSRGRLADSNPLGRVVYLEKEK